MTFILPSIGGGVIASPTAPPFSNTYSVDFDGTNDYMSAAVTELNGISAFSASIWFRFQGSLGGATNIIMSGGDGTSANTGSWYVWLKSATTIQYASQGSNPKDFTISTINNSTWYHLAVVHSGTSATLYLDGSSLGTQTVNALPSSSGNAFNIGRWSPGASYYYNGYADEVSLFDSALSASDITTIYNSGTPNDISSLNPVGWWRMGDIANGTGTTITDQGSGGNDGTLTNGPTFSTNVPDVLPSITNTYSVEFDGTDDRIEIPTITEFNAPSAFSTSHWFNYSGTPSTSTHVLMSAGISSSDRFYIELTSSTNIRYGNGNTYDDITISSVSASNWYNLVTIQNGTSLDVYLNGNKQGGTVTVNAPSSGYGSNFLIGAYGAGGSIIGEWQGLLDEVATWDSVLSASDISNIYNSGVPNDISSLSPVGWWRMGDIANGTGTTITDQGSGGNNGTLTNGPTFSTTVPS